MGEKPILGQVAEQHVGLVPKWDSALQSMAKMRNRNVLRTNKKAVPASRDRRSVHNFLKLGSGDRAP